MIMEKKIVKDKTIELLRHLLGSIDLSDIEQEKDQTPAERQAYCSAISAVWPRLEEDIKKFLYMQLIFSSNNAETWDHVLFGRGTFNGIALLEDHWRKAHNEHMERNRGKESFDEHNPIGEM